jgi:hypothetical protein
LPEAVLPEAVLPEAELPEVELVAPESVLDVSDELPQPASPMITATGIKIFKRDNFIRFIVTQETKA